MPVNGGTGFMPLVIILVVALACVALFIFMVVIPFSRDKSYIKMEMTRTAGSREHKYWERKLKRLYVSYIPIVGRALEKRMKR